MGPPTAAAKLSERVPEEKRANALVLDVAAGTGRVGEALAGHGFKIIDALGEGKSCMLCTFHSCTSSTGIVIFISRAQQKDAGCLGV